MGKVLKVLSCYPQMPFIDGKDDVGVRLVKKVGGESLGLPTHTQRDTTEPLILNTNRIFQSKKEKKITSIDTTIIIIIIPLTICGHPGQKGEGGRGQIDKVCNKNSRNAYSSLR